MKKLVFAIFMVLCVISLMAQESENKNNKEIYFTITKHNSIYKYYKDYDGYLGASMGFAYSFNDRWQLGCEYNYGFMKFHDEYYNYIYELTIVNTNANDHTINIGVNYKFLNKEKFNIAGFIGTGFELIYLVPKLENINFHYSSMGIPITAKIRFSYVINKNFSLFAESKCWYGFMINDIAKSPINNKTKIYYYTTFFFSYGIGLSYMF